MAGGGEGGLKEGWLVEWLICQAFSSASYFIIKPLVPSRTQRRRMNVPWEARVGGQSGREGESCVEAGAVPGPLTCKLTPPEPCCRQHTARPCSKKSVPKDTSK